MFLRMCIMYTYFIFMQIWLCIYIYIYIYIYIIYYTHVFLVQNVQISGFILFIVNALSLCEMIGLFVKSRIC